MAAKKPLAVKQCAAAESHMFGAAAADWPERADK